MKVVLQDIVRNVSKAAKLTLPDAQVVVRKIISTLEGGLLNGQKIEIRDFGVFQVKTVSGKKGRDMNRGLSMDLPPYQKVSFKAGKNIKKLFWDLPPENGEAVSEAGGQLEMLSLMGGVGVRQPKDKRPVGAGSRG
jgi:nucleoid DNA-binding protein